MSMHIFGKKGIFHVSTRSVKETLAQLAQIS
jgi:hypothetical protein